MTMNTHICILCTVLYVCDVFMFNMCSIYNKYVCVCVFM